jgi:N-acetylglucosamine kinase-like BadF-type ATPase
VLIAGTGSIVLARNGAGQLTRVGGWGHILGDAGSAYWIAVESVKAAIAAQEGLGPKTQLGSVICRWFEVSRLSEIVPLIHRADFAKNDLASLSSHLARRMGHGDAVFRGICRNAGRQLAAQTLAAAKFARLPARGLPVFLVGSVVTHNKLVRASLIAALKAVCSVRLAKPKLAPALAAAAMALVDAGVETTASVVANLSQRSSLGNPQRR